MVRFIPGGPRPPPGGAVLIMGGGPKRMGLIMPPGCEPIGGGAPLGSSDGGAGIVFAAWIAARTSSMVLEAGRRIVPSISEPATPGSSGRAGMRILFTADGDSNGPELGPAYRAVRL